MGTADRIREKMKEKGIKQNELARMADISKSGLSVILNGKTRPREDSLWAIAQALGCPVGELLGDEREEETSYTWTERNLIDNFRSLSRPGKEYILQTMAMAVITYAEKNPSLPGMEEAE